MKILVIIQSWPLKYYSGRVKGSEIIQTSYAQSEEHHFDIISTPVRCTKHTCMTTRAQTPEITLASTHLHAPLLFTHIYTQKETNTDRSIVCKETETPHWLKDPKCPVEYLLTPSGSPAFIHTLQRR